MDTSGPDAQQTSVALTLGQDGGVTAETVEENARRIPTWVQDPEQSEKVWGAYNAYLRGVKHREIAVTYGVALKTIYRWLEYARAELPYHVISQVSELANMRMQWVQMAWNLAEQIQDSQLRIDRKAEQVSKLLNAAGAWMTAIEELSGARRGTGSRININASGEGQTAILFDMDKLLKAQQPIEH